MAYNLDWVAGQCHGGSEVRICGTGLFETATMIFRPTRSRYCEFAVSISLPASRTDLLPETTLAYDQERRSYWLTRFRTEVEVTADELKAFEYTVREVFDFFLPVHRLTRPLVAPSVPEPPPKQRGVEVTPLLLTWLREGGYSQSLCDLIEARRQYGLNKYGQSLYSGDGRDSYEDARQEAGDLLQYLFKASLQPELNHGPVDGIIEILGTCLSVTQILKQKVPGQVFTESLK
jgi:hypothetical protein